MAPTSRAEARPEGMFSGLADKIREVEHAASRQQERFAAIMEIGRAVGSTLDLDQVLKLVMDHTTRVLNAERSTLYLVDHERQEIWSRVVGGDVKEIRQPLTRGIAGWVCRNDQAVNVPDASKDPRFNPEVDRATGFKTRSMLAVPMHDVTGGVMGAVQVLNRRDAPEFTADDQMLLEAIAAQAGVAIENARLYRDAVQKNRELSLAKEALTSALDELDLLYDLEKRIGAASTFEGLFDEALARLTAFVGVDAGSILLIEDETGQLYFKSAVGEKGEEARRYRLDPGEGIAGEVAATGKPIMTDEASKHPSYDPSIPRRIGFPVKTALCVPIDTEAGTIGALELLNKRGGKFDERDLRTATLAAAQIARAITLQRGRAEGERKARLAVIGQMISGMLHDLRTPMTIISGYAQLMAEEDDRDERQKSAEVILKQFDHINAMAKETLAFARGEQDILLRKVLVQKFVEEVSEFLQKDFEGRNVELKVQLNYKGAVRLDEYKIKRAIYNIARNAAQAMPQGGRFTFAVDKEEGFVLFRFTDTGGGIPDEIADKLFQSFVTSGKKDGTGLGLAMVKKMVEAHGGDVSFKSRSGKGTTFTLRIPA